METYGDCAAICVFEAGDEEGGVCRRHAILTSSSSSTMRVLGIGHVDCLYCLVSFGVRSIRSQVVVSQGDRIKSFNLEKLNIKKLRDGIDLLFVLGMKPK